MESIISSCGGLVAILPDRGQGITSKYMLKGIEMARSFGLPFLVVAVPSVKLAEDLDESAVRIAVNDDGNNVTGSLSPSESLMLL